MTDAAPESAPAPVPPRGGPKSPEGVERCKLNATRHGLRAVETVVPGEDPAAWEGHRAAVVADLAPLGALELALAEQVAAKLWRLGRVVRHEADLIANAQDPDELARAHEKAHDRLGGRGLRRAEIPTRRDVEEAKGEANKAEGKVADLEAALRTLEALAAMGDEDRIEDWSIYEPLKRGLRLRDRDTDSLFKDEDEPFVARHLRAMLGKRGPVAEVTEGMAAHWRDAEIPELRGKAAWVRQAYKALLRRYRAAIERRRRSHGLPRAEDLDRIQRYEAHLERGLHRDLDRLRDLQSARGAAPPRPPSVAVAVVQAGPAPGAEPSPFGRIALEAPSPDGPGPEAGYNL